MQQACWGDEAHEPTHCHEAERYPKLRACIDKVSRAAMGQNKEQPMLYVGIDVAKNTLAVCVLGASKQQREFGNNRKGHQQLLTWLKKQPDAVAIVGLEATGSYGEAICSYLYEQELRVSVINPARIKAYAQSQLKRHKTDAIDAELIADFCRTQQPEAWSPPPPEELELRALVRHLDDLKAQRQAEKNRLEAQPGSKTVVQNLQAHIRFIDEQIQQLEHAIHDHINRHPHLKQQRDLLKSIPGIGDITSLQILAELGDLTRFSDVRQVVALAGLNPQQRRSGTSVHYTAGISRMGRSSLRAALFMPAMVAMRHNPILKAFAERLAHNGLKPKQVITAVMRKLLHLAYGILKNKEPFNPNYLALCS
jgi:transposase